MTRLSGFVYLAATVVVLIACIDLSHGEPKSNCKEVLSDLTKRQMGGIAACSKSMTFKNGKDKAAKMNCVLKCVMIKEGLLGPDGRLTADDMSKFLDKEFAPELIGSVKPLFMKCYDTTAAAMDPDEEFCKTYDPFIKCLMGTIGNMCPK